MARAESTTTRNHSDQPPTDFTAGELIAMRRALLNWAKSDFRQLPWREIADPYRVWVSEVMLQQTTVAAVIPYYLRFLQRFPTLDDLASADESEVLRLWEGLGYYSRARNLHRGAREIVSRCRGIFPDDPDELQSLPGIGRYTAGAIASFAFDRRAPIVEANTLRLYSRLLGFETDPRSGAGQRAMWRFADEILPRSQPGRFNQALMDLGAKVCTPVEPSCPQCPLKPWCRALRHDRVAEIPRATRRPAVTEVIACAVAVRRGGRFLLRQCQPGERWAGLWDFPRFEVDSMDMIELRRLVRDLTGFEIELEREITTIRHAVTRYRITLHCILAAHCSGRLKRGETWTWAAPDRLESVPLSMTGRKFARQLGQSADSA